MRRSLRAEQPQQEGHRSFTVGHEGRDRIRNDIVPNILSRRTETRLTIDRDHLGLRVVSRLTLDDVVPTTRQLVVKVYEQATEIKLTEIGFLGVERGIQRHDDRLGEVSAESSLLLGGERSSVKDDESTALGEDGVLGGEG